MLHTHTEHIDARALWRVLDVTRKLGEPIDLNAMLAAVIDAARDVLSADRATVFLFDEKNNELYTKVAHGLQEIRFPANAGIAGQCAQTRTVLNIPDCYADSRFNQEIDRKTGYRTRCLLTVPLIGSRGELVGVMQVLNRHNGVFEEDDERIATALAVQCAVALQRARLIEEQMIKQKLERDLSLARDIQLGLLPTSMPELAGYEIAGWSRPADQTGGDIYDVMPVDDDRMMLLLCDATGHGIGPALSVSQVRSMFRMAMRLNADLDAMYNHVNDQLCADLADNRFVTAFVGMLDTQRHLIDYHAGGQGPLLHLHAATGACQMIDASTFPMGIMAGADSPRPTPIEMAPGDIFALISDGVFEYIGPDNKQFGDDRVVNVIKQHRDKPMAELIVLLDQAVKSFSHGYPQADDMTIVLLKRLAD